MVGTLNSVLYSSNHVINTMIFFALSQCGTSTDARKVKEDEQKQSTNQKVYAKSWTRKMPYDFTGCLAHIDITFTVPSQHIIRLAGILEHNEACKKKVMKRLPPIPLHPHVFQIALQQINEGAKSVYTSFIFVYSADFYPAWMHCKSAI